MEKKQLKPRVVWYKSLAARVIGLFVAASIIAGAFVDIDDARQRLASYVLGSRDPPVVGGAIRGEKPKIENLPLDEQNPPLVDEEFSNSAKKWRSPYFRQDGDELCVVENEDFPLPSMWYSGATLRLAFSPIVIEYQATGPKDGNNPFIISIGIGDGEEYFRIFLQEGESHLIGIAKVKGGNRAGQLVRESRKRSLTNPIKSGSDVKVTIVAKRVDRSVIEYELIVDYVSAETGRTRYDPFIIEVESPHVSPGEIDVQLGISTTAGDCIKPLRYEIY